MEVEEEDGVDHLLLGMGSAWCNTEDSLRALYNLDEGTESNTQDTNEL